MTTRGIIVCYVVSPVHQRNLALLAQGLPGWEFRMVYERRLGGRLAKSNASRGVEAVPLTGRAIPPSVWEGPVRAVLFSSAHPRLVPLFLLRDALARRIPAIAVEETHQLALNQGVVNNYLLPVDRVLVASAFERDAMIGAGVPARRVEVTGWPFYAGRPGPVDPAQREETKRRLGLDPRRPVATVVLTSMREGVETADLRQRQLAIASQGIPARYQLLIKPHPIDPVRLARSCVAASAPQARLLTPTIGIEEILDATDLVLNRGTSQVCIEALLRGIPVAVLDVGVGTPFRELVPQAVAREAADLSRVVRWLEAGKERSLEAYRPWLATHCPYGPEEAREATCRRIAEIAERGDVDQDRAGQWFDLGLDLGWQRQPRVAVELLRQHALDQDRWPVHPLIRLLEGRAARTDLETLKRAVGASFQSHVLRCLWIDQLHRRGEAPRPDDVAWMAEFPPAMNVTTFVAHLRRWVDQLFRAGHGAVACAIAKRLAQGQASFREVAAVIRDIGLYQTGRLGRLRYHWHQLAHHARLGLVSLRYTVGL